MVCYIVNKDSTMYVHEVSDTFVVWVTASNKINAKAFRHETALEWCKLVEKMTGIECELTNPKRPGLL